MITFRDANEPEQPCRGVYRWYVEASGSEAFTLYVGEAGARKRRGFSKPSTLRRGISEAQLGSVSSDKGSSIDTDQEARTPPVCRREHSTQESPQLLQTNQASDTDDIGGTQDSLNSQSNGLKNIVIDISESEEFPDQ